MAAAGAARGSRRGAAAPRPADKTLKIKVGVVKRTLNDLEMYKKEVAQEEERLDKLVTSGGDESDQKLQRTVIEEASAMIPDTLRRLEAAVEDLASFVEEHESVAGVAGTALLTEAQTLVTENAPAADYEDTAAAGAATSGVADDEDEMED